MQLALYNNDLVIDNNRFVMVSGAEEIKQLIICKLNTFLGEYFLDASIGIPYYQVIFEKGTAPEIIYSIFLNQILNIDGVREVIELDLDIDYQKRVATLNLECMVLDNEYLTFRVPLGVL